MRGEHREPEGLIVEPDVLSPQEESLLLDRLDSLDYDTVELRGQVARRTVRLFGYGYDFTNRTVMPADPIPDWLLGLRNRCGQLADVAPGAFVHALVNRYTPGATIGWHRDAPPFGPTVVGVSLGAEAEMRFQRRIKGTRWVWQQPLPRRSGYVLSGPARSAWEHSVPAGEALRYSITFRTLRAAPGSQR